MTTHFFDAGYAQTAREILLNNYRHKITIVDLATKVGVGEKTLQRAFKSEFNMGIYEFVLKVRMEKAEEYLLSRNKSVKQIAWLVGYKRQSSFTKRFMKKYGVSPSEWAATMS
jgi:two-component system, response regulator YesN